ncbi:MAG: hypothetical protein ACRCUM_02625, partial [Mycoplasmoidaceae bacterium]
IKLSLLGALITCSALAVTLPIVSCSSSTINPPTVEPIYVTVNSNDLIAVETIATDLLIDAIKDIQTIDGQKIILDSWSLGKELSTEDSDLIKSNLNFKNSSGETINGNVVIESVIFNSNVQLSSLPGEIIKGPELKVNLKTNEYISQTDVLIETSDIGFVASGNLNLIDDGGLDRTERTITRIKADLIRDSLNKKALVESWLFGREVSSDILEIVKSNLNFDINGTSVSGNLAIKSVTYNTSSVYPPVGEIIRGPQLRINFYSKYDSLTEFLIQVSDLAIAT